MIEISERGNLEHEKRIISRRAIAKSFFPKFRNQHKIPLPIELMESVEISPNIFEYICSYGIADIPKTKSHIFLDILCEKLLEPYQVKKIERKTKLEDDVKNLKAQITKLNFDLESLKMNLKKIERKPYLLPERQDMEDCISFLTDETRKAEFPGAELRIITVENNRLVGCLIIDDVDDYFSSFLKYGKILTELQKRYDLEVDLFFSTRSEFNEEEWGTEFEKIIAF